MSDFTKKLKHVLPLSNLSTPFASNDSTNQKKSAVSDNASSSKRQKLETSGPSSKAASSSGGPAQTPIVPTIPLGNKLSGEKVSEKEGNSKLAISVSSITGNIYIATSQPVNYKLV